MDQMSEKDRAGSFPAANRSRLWRSQYKHIITQKGNIVTITKNREAAWQKNHRSVECISSVKHDIF